MPKWLICTFLYLEIIENKINFVQLYEIHVTKSYTKIYYSLKLSY